MVLESENIGGGGGREGTDRNEGGNLLDGSKGKKGGGGAWELSRLLCASAGGLVPPEALATTVPPHPHLQLRNPHSGVSVLAECRWWVNFLADGNDKKQFLFYDLFWSHRILTFL
jgi:hypothetical protein